MIRGMRRKISADHSYKFCLKGRHGHGKGLYTRGKRSGRRRKMEDERVLVTETRSGNGSNKFS